MKTSSLRCGARRGVVAGGQVARGVNQRGGGVSGAGFNCGVANQAGAQESVGRKFGRLLDWAVDSGGWLLIVVSLFILLPVGVMYLASRGMKDSEPVNHARVEADILTPVNIFAD